MTPTIPLLHDDEVRRCLPSDEEAGFGALTTPRGRLPLKALDVQARIDGLLAEVTVSQTFVNVLGEPLEATYVFPLPDRAAVTHFRMEVGGRVVEGALKERGAARREYDRAVQTGYRAAIAEEERPGVFTLRVGNLMPGEAATVRLTLAGPLLYDMGEVTFRFPLVVAPRYIPGFPLAGPSVGDGVASDTDAVPDASRITPPVLLPGLPNPVRLSLTVDVEPSALAPRDFRCSLHAALLQEDGCGAGRIVLQPGERLNRDFILRFRVGQEVVKSSLSLLPDRTGREGTFVLTLVPPVAAVKAPRPRDVVFVLDRSGSMTGWKMVAARRALGRMVDTLTERDRFTVYAFDDAIETPPEFHGRGLAEATDRNRFRAVEFLARVDARGGTEMAQPLDLAVKQLADGADAPQRDRILVLITDGQVANEDQILRLLGKRLGGLRVFTLGIDQAVNEGFLRRLATLGGGFCEVVESEDRLDEVMKKLHSRIGTPLLTGLQMEAAGFSVDGRATVPGRIPDLFAGAALMVLGRYQGVPEGTFLLSGEDNAGRRWSEAVSGRVSNNPALVKAWARAYLRELEDRFAIGQGDVSKLERQIVEVSLKFGVLCRFTSFVAVDRAAVVNEGGEQHRMIQPVEMPAEWAGNTAAQAAYRSPCLGAMPVLPCASPLAPPGSNAQPPMRVEEPLALDDEDGEDDDSHLFACYEETLEEEEPASPLGKPKGPPPPPKPATPPAGKARQSSSKREGHFRSLDRRAASSKPPTGAKKATRGPGLLKKMVNAVFGHGKGKDQAPPPAAPTQEPPVSTPEPEDHLAAYRQRGQEMLDQLTAATSLNGSQRLHELGVLSLKLRALVEDLKSVSAASTVVQPLEELHGEMQEFLMLERYDEGMLSLVWMKSETVLKAFAEGIAAPVPASADARRAQFWK